MDNDKILAAAQKNKGREGEYEQNEASYSNYFGTLVALIVAVVLFLAEYIAKGAFNSGLIAVMATALGVPLLRDGIKAKKTRTIIHGALLTFIAAANLISALFGIIRA